MKPILASQLVATELVKEKAKLVILSGSAAKGRDYPNDLDICAVFPPKNNLLDRKYRHDLVERLSSEVGYKIDLFDFAEGHIDDLIELYNKDSWSLCVLLNDICMDSVRDQWKGWPLAWIFGEKAEESLNPYGCFQNEFMVLEGQEYLDELRSRIKVPQKV